jgi:hypothetical protein
MAVATQHNRVLARMLAHADLSCTLVALPINLLNKLIDLNNVLSVSQA